MLKLIRKLVLITIITISVPIFIGIASLFWVAGFIITLLAKILSIMSGK